MPQLQPLLESLKSLICLEKSSLIASRLDSLRPYTGQQPALTTLIALLEQERYPQALEQITQLLRTTTEVVATEDAEVTACNLELKGLEAQLRALLERFSELQARVEEFTHYHHEQLGRLIEQILKTQHRIREGELALSRMPLRRREAHIKRYQRELKEDLATTQRTLIEEELATMRQALREEEARLHSDHSYREAEQQRREAEQEAEQYRQELAKQAQYPELNKEERQQLKQTYRKACKLVHPDLAPDEFKEEATNMMVALNQAKERQDLVRLNELLAQLEAGYWGRVSSTYSDLTALKMRISTLLAQQKTVQQEITQLQQSEVGQLLASNPDLDDYFARQRLELDDLQNQLNIEQQALQRRLHAAEQELLNIERGNMGVMCSDKGATHSATCLNNRQDEQKYYQAKQHQ